MIRLAIVCAILQGCGGYYYARAGVGHNESTWGASIPWENGGGTGAMLGAGYRAPIPCKWQIGCYDLWIDANWTHLSQYEPGPPLVPRIDESSVDHYGAAVELRF